MRMRALHPDAAACVAGRAAGCLFPFAPNVAASRSRFGALHRRDERPQSDPAPIDPVARDARADDVDRFDQADLIALRRFAQIFPDQLTAVREERVGAMPACELVRQLPESGREERADCRAALQDVAAALARGDAAPALRALLLRPSRGARGRRGDAADADARLARGGVGQALRRHAGGPRVVLGAGRRRRRPGRGPARHRDPMSRFDRAPASFGGPARHAVDALPVRARMAAARCVVA